MPVLFRTTTRVSHSKSLVTFGEREEQEVPAYERNTRKYICAPDNAYLNHPKVEKNLAALEEYGNTCSLNKLELKGTKVGVITASIAYQYAKDAFPEETSFLKLGLTYPLPMKLIREFAAQVEKLYVIEELEPFMEEQIKAAGIPCVGKELTGNIYELNPQLLAERLFSKKAETVDVGVKAVSRPPALCPGCPHRGFFYALTKYLNKSIVPIGDIGCYTLGINAPLNALDATICMGAGISSIIGLAKALEMQGDTRKPLGCVGDSTFFHSGMTSLMDVVAADANVIACVLDNSITAMTGHQDNPGTAKNLMGEPSPMLDIERLARATGINPDHVRVVDPLDIEAVHAAIDAALNVKGPFVIITKRPCALIKEVQKANANKHCVIDAQKCRGCKQCMKIACPAIAFEGGKARIFDPASCTGCGLCAHMCRFGAIERRGE